MFDAFLSGRVFGLSGSPSSLYLDIAREWSGQWDLRPTSSGGAVWEDLTRVGVGSYQWREAPPPTQIRVKNALVPLGAVEETAFYAFISPLSGLPAAFRRAAATYLRDSGDRQGALIERIEINLIRYASDNWGHMFGSIRTVEGETSSGYHVVATRPKRLSDLSLVSVHAIEFDSGNRLTRVDDEFNIRVGDVSAEFEDIAASLRQTFELLQNYIKFSHRLKTINLS